MKSIDTFLLLLFTAFLSTGIFCYAQDGGPNQQDLENSFELDNSFSIQATELDSLITWQERIMVHLDKSVLTKDAPLFFKAYTLTGPNRVRATLSKVLKVELLNSKKQLVVSQYHKIENGMSEGAIEIPKKLDEGVYTLRAYTRWMQNYGEPFYFIKELQLGSMATTKDKDRKSIKPLNISFHPEGGNLIENFSNRLLIKRYGSTREIDGFNGEIIDSKNNLVATLVPFGRHISSAIFTPNRDESYTLKTKDDAKYPLPNSLSKGYLLSVNNLDQSSLSIRVQATSEFDNSKVWLKGEMSGITYFKKELQLKKSSIKINVPKKGIPSGVMTVSLNDDEGKQWARRPISIDVKNDLKLSILPLDQDTNKDELAFKVIVTDSKGEPVTTEVSLSATNYGIDSGLLEAVNSKEFNWELYESSEKGKPSKRKERFMDDLELLTLIDANYNMVSQKVPNKIKYPFQEGLDLFGYAYNLDNKLLKDTKIQMVGSSDEDVVAQEFKTDASGRIRLENLQLVGETELIFRTVGDDSSSRLVKVVPFQENFETKNISKSMVNSKKKGKIVSTSPWHAVDEDELVELEEVEVIEKKLEEKKSMPSVYGIQLTRVKYQNVERPRTIPQLFLGIPGVRVVGLGNLKPRVSLPRAAGVGPVLWVLDGIPLLQPTGLFDIMNLVSYVDVERIEVLFGPEASIYGTRAGGGAILIYTRSGAGMDYLNRKDGHLNFQGYFESPSFDEYIKEVDNRPKKYKNALTTLFWDPKIKTNQNGEAIIRFKVPIDYKQLELKASTISAKGEIGSVKVIF